MMKVDARGLYLIVSIPRIAQNTNLAGRMKFSNRLTAEYDWVL